MKIKAGNYLSQLQQKIQHDASQIDNYLEQRVVILQNCARLLDKAIDLDKTTMTQIAAYRSGVDPAQDGARNEVARQIDSVGRSINLAFDSRALRQGPRRDRRCNAAERLFAERDHRRARAV